MDMQTSREVYEYDGEIVTIKRRSYCAAPLSLRQIKTLLPKISKISSFGASPNLEQQAEVFDLLVEVIHASLSRNHRDLTQDTLFDDLDAAMVMPLFDQIMTVSGLRKGEAANREGKQTASTGG